jgi:hypothetical protein
MLIAGSAAFTLLAWRLHRPTMKMWQAFFYFFPWGISVFAGSFALVNLALARFQAGVDGYGWFMLLAAIGAGLATVCGIPILISLATLRQQLKWWKLGLMTLMFVGLYAGVMWVIADMPEWNWW